MLFFCTAGSKQRNVVVLVAENCCCNRFYFADPGILVLAAMLCLCWIQDISLARARLVDSQIPFCAEVFKSNLRFAVLIFAELKLVGGILQYTGTS
ncbi:hypothetical protein P8452_28789 [Trifolium repens]|nr:hypothetical protein P8452_28789 [Trifolium repens]